MKQKLYIGMFCALSLITAPLLAIWPFSADNFVPTVENLHTCTLIPAHISTDESIPKIGVADLMAQTNTHTLKRSTLIAEGSPNAIVEPGIHIRDDQQALFLFSPYFTMQKVKTEPGAQTYSHREPGGGTYGASRFIKNKFINGECISFDYHDTLGSINFTQELDQQCLETVFDKIVQQAPHKKIILYGPCRGATNILKFLVQRAKPVHFNSLSAVVLEAPALSLQALIPQTVRSRPAISWTGAIGENLAYAIIRAALPNHSANDGTVIIDNIEQIPKELPILIVHLQNDTSVPGRDMRKLITRLKETGHTSIHLLVMYDKNLGHAHISKAVIYQQVTNAFLKYYNLPHDTTLAAQGDQAIFFDPVTKKLVDLMTLTKSMAQAPDDYIDNQATQKNYDVHQQK